MSGTASPVPKETSQKEIEKTNSQSSISNASSSMVSRYHGMSLMSEYEKIKDLGKGTFGVVSKAKKKSDGKYVALKQLIIHDTKDGFPITAFREITIMKKFSHVNVLQLIDMIHEPSREANKPGCFYTVTPYMSSDLNGLLHNPRISLTVSQRKCILQQLLLGINYIHGMKFLHRDIKTANILMDYFGVVKIADFGLARVYHGQAPRQPDSLPGGGEFEYTGLVVTRWYRPPELLLGERKYTTAVDMWGIGCVMGELYKRKPILEGKSDLDQADIIFRLVGPPTDSSMPGFRNLKGNGVNTNVDYPRTLEKEFQEIGPKGITLLSGLLTLDPKKRFNAAKALEHEFFVSQPLPCKPNQLPKFEESHESDVDSYREQAREKAELSPPHHGQTGWKSGVNTHRSTWTRGANGVGVVSGNGERNDSNRRDGYGNGFGNGNGSGSGMRRDWNLPRHPIPAKPRSQFINATGISSNYQERDRNGGSSGMYNESKSILSKLKDTVHNNGLKRKEHDNSEDGVNNKRSRI